MPTPAACVEALPVIACVATLVAGLAAEYSAIEKCTRLPGVMLAKIVARKSPLMAQVCSMPSELSSPDMERPPALTATALAAQPNEALDPLHCQKTVLRSVTEVPIMGSVT